MSEETEPTVPVEKPESGEHFALIETTAGMFLFVGTTAGLFLFIVLAWAIVDSTMMTTTTVTPSMSQSQIQAVCTSAFSGSKVRFMPGTYALSGTGLSFGHDDVTIDASGATITQSTWGVPAFDLIGRNHMTLDVHSARFVGTRGGQGTFTRGQAGYTIGAAVYITGDHNWVRTLTSVNFAVGVNLSGWNGSTAWGHQGIGNRIGKMEVSGMDWGVLWARQSGLVIDDIYGHDDIDDSGGVNPTHVLYGSARTGSRDQAVTIKKVRAANILSGQPVQVKYSDDLTLRNLFVTNSRGVLNLIDCNSLDIDGVIGTQILANGGQGAWTIQSTNTFSQRPRVANVSIQLAANVDEPAMMSITDDGQWSKISVETNHSFRVRVSTPDINIRGTGNVYRDVRDNQLGTVGVLGIEVGGTQTGNNTRIINPVVTGASAMVAIVGGSTGVVVDYNRGAQSVSTFITNAYGTGTETWSTRLSSATTLTTFAGNSRLSLSSAATRSLRFGGCSGMGTLLLLGW